MSMKKGWWLYNGTFSYQPKDSLFLKRVFTGYLPGIMIFSRFRARNKSGLAFFPQIPTVTGEMVSLPGQGFQGARIPVETPVLKELIFKEFSVHTPHAAIH